MTIVNFRRERTPVQAQVQVTKRANTASKSSPQLARGRHEKLVQSRSPTPPDYGRMIQASAEVLSPMQSVESSSWDRPDSPIGSLSDARTPAFSLSTASWASPEPPPQPRRKRAYDESQYSESYDTEGQDASYTASDGTTRAGPSRSYSSHTTSTFYRPAPTSETEFSLSMSPARYGANGATSPDAWNDRRPLPIAPWPMGKVRTSDDVEMKDRSIPSVQKKKGIKPAYDSQEKKDKVKAVRISGACIRCSVFRQACEVLVDGQSCKACGVVSRKWHIPCTRLWLKGRWIYLVPDKFFDHLSLADEYAFPRYPPANRGPSFSLTLAKQCGLKIPVKVFPVIGKPIKSGEFEKFQFEPDSAEPVKWPTLPLMPEHSYANVTNIATTVKEYMHKYSRDPDSEKLPEVLFPVDNDEPFHAPWVRDIFDLMCKFQQFVVHGESQAIAYGLKTIFVMFLVGRTFWVPGDKIVEMNNHLDMDWKLMPEVLQKLVREEYSMCPKYADRFVKAALLKLLKTSLMPNCFGLLEELYHLTEKDHGKSILTELSRDEAFCATAIVLLLAGNCQIKMIHIYRTRVANNWKGTKDIPGGPEQLYQEAVACIYEIEREIIDHLLYLYTYQFGKEKMVGEVKPEQKGASMIAASFNLTREFKNSKGIHSDSLDRINPVLDMERTSQDQFVRENMARVLLRLDQVIWRPKSKRS